jgi:opacity protein-like surface antigen
MNLSKTCLLLCSLFVLSNLTAQDSSLLKMINDSASANAKPTPVTGTFKGNHFINMQTIEAPAKGALSFIIMHRFGALNSGAYNLFGLDDATLRLGLDYGITDRFSVGLGRSTIDKAFDGYLKYKLLLQTDGNQMPVTVDILTTISNFTQDYTDEPYLNTTYRTDYTAQLLIAKKFKQFSLELTPTFLHYNLVPTVNDANNLFALGAGARVKLTNRMSILGEYDYVPTGQVVSTPYYNSMSFAWEMETGGHVFQLVFSNSQSIIEPYYLTKTTGTWSKGDIYFGFNISRNFNITKHAKMKTSM